MEHTFSIGEILHYSFQGESHTGMVIDVCYDYQTETILEGYFVTGFCGMVTLDMILPY